MNDAVPPEAGHDVRNEEGANGHAPNVVGIAVVEEAWHVKNLAQSDELHPEQLRVEVRGSLAGGHGVVDHVNREVQDRDQVDPERGGAHLVSPDCRELEKLEVL